MDPQICERMSLRSVLHLGPEPHPTKATHARLDHRHGARGGGAPAPVAVVGGFALGGPLDTGTGRVADRPGTNGAAFDDADGPA